MGGVVNSLADMMMNPNLGKPIRQWDLGDMIISKYKGKSTPMPYDPKTLMLMFAGR